jgi:hypothetical protein
LEDFMGPSEHTAAIPGVTEVDGERVAASAA